ncbi:MAG: inositol monophosphatase family protein [Candidatus Nanopelagicales bacterium]
MTDRRADCRADCALARQLAEQAGVVLQEFRGSFVAPPGTDRPVRALRDAADAAAQDFLAAALTTQRPEDAVLSEEAADSAERDDAERVWIIDPLDGTFEYGAGRSDWAVHVALWERSAGPAGRGALTAGAIALPDEALVFCSDLPQRPPEPATDRPLRIIASRSRPPAGLPAVATALAGAWADLGGPRDAEIVQVGSVGAKVARLLTGRAEVYLHDSGFYEWDVAAPLAVAQAAGLHAAHVDGSLVTFNHRPPYVTDLAVCRPELTEALAQAVHHLGS